ncbi:hypothetical protein BC833DRAFT_595960 [Globomyces pollinis-pini]|nr:hypothetical protein BC833DRAFT_595960 [Globomyces pollinis-pini]
MNLSRNWSRIMRISTQSTKMPSLFYKRHLNCWSCTKLIDHPLFCNQCHVIQPLKINQLNYTDTFNIPNQFNIDLKQLKLEFLKLQQQLHPDNFSTKSKDERVISEEQSSYVNKAYETLKDPLSRAQYMLALKGKNIHEGHMNVKQDFLLEVMEIQEDIEDCERQELDQYIDENNSRIENSVKVLEELFNKDLLDEALEETMKLKYWYTIARLLSSRDDEL